MILDVPKCTRICCATKRELRPEEPIFSVLFENEDEYVRLDYSADAWPGPPDRETIGWWKTRIPSLNDKKVKLAPNDILLNLFDSLGEQVDKEEMRYILVLLLVRKRLFRFEKEDVDENGRRMMTVYCGKRDMLYTLPVAVPEKENAKSIQDALAELLY